MRSFGLGIILILCISQDIYSQSIIKKITGKITDAITGEPLTAAAVVAYPSGKSSRSDFEGNYILNVPSKTDSIVCYLSGYRSRVHPLKDTTFQIIDFQLNQQVEELKSLRVSPKMNPAFRIMDSVVAHKKDNSPEYIQTYDCENFNRIELAVNNISDKFRDSRLTKNLKSLLDTAHHLAGENGKAILPVFISETITDFYYQQKPEKVKEIIKATKVTGIGVEDGSTISQLTGSLFQKYNFYDNWIKVVDKQFLSPLANQAKKSYYFKLMDTVEIDGERCWQIQVRKKYKAELLFTGSLWITENGYALKQFILNIDRSANLNFIENLKIQQIFSKTESGFWLPVKTRISADIEQLTGNSAGMLARYYTTSSKLKINTSYPPSFFDERITLAEDARVLNDTFWNRKREETGGQQDQRFYLMVDSIRNLKVVQTYTRYVDFLVNGYYRAGKFDVGPYLVLYNQNAAENHRFRIGFKSNYKLSRNFAFSAYTAYGFRDHKWKYQATVSHVFQRKPWVKAGFIYRNDIEPLGLGDMNFIKPNSLFAAFALFTSLQRFGYVKDKSIYLEYAPLKGLTTFLYAQHKTFSPAGPFTFSWLDVDGKIRETFSNAKITLDVRFSAKDVYIQNDNERINLSTENSPIFTLGYTRGIKGILGSDFAYHHLKASIYHYMYFRKLGSGYYKLTGSWFPNALPYPLLDIQRGNQSFIYNSSTYNLMNFVEFVTDKSLAVEYQHYFEGLGLDRIKKVREWKLRTFIHGRGLWGSISSGSLAMLPNTNMIGNSVDKFRALGNTPYVELGYGVENIFKFLRLDFVHRITYLDYPDVRKFGVKASLQLKI